MVADAHKNPSWLGKILAQHPWFIFASMLLLVVVMLSIVGNALWLQRQEMVRHAAENAENLALISEREITRTLQLFDFSMQAVKDGALNPDVPTLKPAIRQQLLFDRSATAGKYLGSLLYVGADGTIVYDSQAPFPPHDNFADRPWFYLQRQFPDLGLYISPPYRSYLHGGRLSIALSRRVQRADGRFAGVVLGEVNLDYFRDLFSGLKLGSNGAVNLYTDSGSIIMRVPYQEKWIGLDISASANFQRGKLGREPYFFGTSNLDGANRLYVIRHFKELPMLISVAQSRDEMDVMWWQQVRTVVLLMSLLALFLLLAAMQLTREFSARLRAERELLLLAEVDGLTALNNRRTFDALFEREWLRAHRVAQPLAVLFVDIDWFKSYNDHYGHQAGDDVLRAVAHTIAATCQRPTDIAARFGGEEFVLILPDTGVRGAARVAERVLANVRELHIKNTGSSYGEVTVSVGYACSDMGVFNSREALLELADQALYLAKEGGRNRATAAVDAGYQDA